MLSRHSKKEGAPNGSRKNITGLADLLLNCMRKKEKLARSLGIENLSRSQVSEMTKGLNKQVQEFHNWSLAGHYPVICTDTLYEKVRVDGRVISMAVLVACGVNVQGQKPLGQWQWGVEHRPAVAEAWWRHWVHWCRRLDNKVVSRIMRKKVYSRLENEVSRLSKRYLQKYPRKVCVKENKAIPNLARITQGIQVKKGVLYNGKDACKLTERIRGKPAI